MRASEYDEAQYHQEYYGGYAFDQPVDEVGDSVSQLVSVAAGHVGRKAQHGAEDYGHYGDEQGPSHTFGKQLPAAVSDEGLVEGWQYSGSARRLVADSVLRQGCRFVPNPFVA